MGLLVEDQEKYRYHGEVLTAIQIAEKTGIPVGTVRSRLSRSFKREPLLRRRDIGTVIDTVKRVQKFHYDVNGTAMSVAEIVEKYRTPYTLTKTRLASGLTVDQFLTEYHKENRPMFVPVWMRKKLRIVHNRLRSNLGDLLSEDVKESRYALCNIIGYPKETNDFLWQEYGMDEITPSKMYWAPREHFPKYMKSKKVGLRPSVFVTYQGEHVSIVELARRNNLPVNAVRYRIEKGWDPSRWFEPISQRHVTR